MPLTDRIIDISESGANLSARNGLLVIGREGGEVTLPLAETAALVIAHPAVRISHGALAGLCAAGGVCVVCDDRHMPTGMLLPISGHTLQGERVAAQAAAPLPMRKHVWKSIVRAKVLAQGRLLEDLRGDDRGLAELAHMVRSGDPVNIEAQASQRYWPALFGDGFHRSTIGDGVNHLLNYGYAVLRAATARAICASGLHPSLGVHHHNRYDAFRLADDLMEPFRPVVDGSVARMADLVGRDIGLDKDSKKDLIGDITEGRFSIDGQDRAFFDTLARVAASLAAVFEGRREDVVLPEY